MSAIIKTLKTKENGTEQNVYPITVLEAVVDPDTNQGLDTIVQSLNEEATESEAGLMSPEDKVKLNGISEDADSVSFSSSLTSGTKVGTITINGTDTDIYCEGATSHTHAEFDDKLSMTLETATDADAAHVAGKLTAYIYNSSTLNTPYTAGLTGVFTAGVILSYGYAAKYCFQMAYPAGNASTYIRALNNGTWTSWTTGYLPLSGGTLSGNLNVTGYIKATSYIKNTGGNIIIGTNNNFLYGASTAGAEYALIGLNSSNQCDVAPTLANVVIGKAATNITIGKAGAAGQATGVTINDSVWINPYNNLVIKKNNCGLYGVNTSGGYVHLIGVNSGNACAIAVDSSNVTIGKSGSTTAVNGKLETSGGVEIRGASSYIDFHYNNDTADYNVRLINNESGKLHCLGHYAPSADNTYQLGYAGKRWKQLYANTSTISTSDRRLKYDFEEFGERYDTLYDLLKPCSFKLVNGDSGRSHSGFVSQDVEEALSQAGLTALDFAGFCKDVKQKSVVVTPAEYDENGNIISEARYESVDDLDENGNLQYDYSLRYEEFIALNTNQIQKLKTRLNTLEEENTELKNKVSSLEERLEKLEALLLANN